MATLKDVARHAGVAISTASAVINRSAPVSADTITRVKAAIEAVGYVPNSAARLLRSGQSNLIGVIIPDVTNPHFSRVARIIEDRCLRDNYMSVLFNSGEEAQREMRVLDMMRSQKVAGLVLMPTRSGADHGEALMKKIEVPTVLLNSYVAGTTYDSIVLDNARAARMAVDHLLRNGHRRIAILAGRPGVSAGDDRLEGCRRAFADHGLEMDESWVFTANFRKDEAFGDTQKFMSSRPRPTAIFSMNNLMTIGAVTALQQMGMRFPDDVSLIGIDDFEFAAILQPGISVVEPPVRQMAEFAIDRLLMRLDTQDDPPERFSFDPTMISRGSVASLV